MMLRSWDLGSKEARFRTLLVDLMDGHRVHFMRFSHDVDCAFLFINLPVCFFLGFFLVSVFCIRKVK